MAKGKQGFASMNKADRTAIASKGGKAAHKAGTAHQWTSDEAAEAGRKGGLSTHANKPKRKGQHSTPAPAKQIEVLA